MKNMQNNKLILTKHIMFTQIIQISLQHWYVIYQAEISVSLDSARKKEATLKENIWQCNVQFPVMLNCLTRVFERKSRETCSEEEEACCFYYENERA